MNAKYSKTTGGIYPTTVYKTFPEDALDIPAELYERFKNGEISGFDAAAGAVIERIAAQPTLAELKTKKQAEIKRAAEVAIVSGITSNTLGTTHNYPTTTIDQQNLNGLITESLLPGSGDEYKFWCADSKGVWARRTHTKLQIQDVGMAVADHVKSQQAAYEQKLLEIAAATTKTVVNSIVWSQL